MSSAAGAGAAFAVLWLYWRVGALGGGDVKLAVAIGAIKGFWFLVWTIACGSLVAGVLAVGYLLARGDFLRHMRRALQLTVRPWMWRHELARDEKPVTIPYGLGLAIGCVWVWVIQNGLFAG